MATRELGRREQLAAFYTSHDRLLRLRVCAGVRGVDDSVIEDACAYAWLVLVRRPDVTLDRRGLCWLALVATQEAWRLASTAHEAPAGAFLSAPDDNDELAEPAGLSDDPLERVIALETHRERVTRFAGLRPRERRDLLLQAGGYRYHEIVRLSLGVRVKVAVLLGADVGDMSPMEASRLPLEEDPVTRGVEARERLTALNVGLTRRHRRGRCRWG
jgi:hypothetical protein